MTNPDTTNPDTTNAGATNAGGTNAGAVNGATMKPAALFDVSGKTVVVTGGSRGIGLMIARGFAESGATVVISSRKADACRQAAEELSASGGTCIAHPADLSTPDGIASLVERVREISPRIDVLVNNAGATWGAPIDEFPDSAFDKVFDVNVKAVFALTQRLLPELRAASREGDPARVINIGSVDGMTVSASDNFSYGASKAAVHMLTRKLAAVTAADGITVNAIAPGPFPSKMMAYALDDPELRSGVLQRIPLGRTGTPEDAAGTAIFLASRAGAYLTGVVIPVDGGLTGAR
ncbi:NAD(P)-dependent dehydrogenase (short-subunit alcohol dehydrogenase family) [Prauserella sediminis]|uniref:NAD(P)-dependent dehydrogenase (Short-subunit alcohol dehydrogenase family) n=2 Tax=Prauserella sediminis TaxID=577680 RepID=A0A839XNE9_9PSEU|nr:NAD(P)-dependent dehydrogenase (short-subunit alcohol dehydrogenase family) [Prauserella sediminis]